jgi:hypothetical protein
MYGTPKQCSFAEMIKQIVISVTRDKETKDIFTTIEDAAWWIDNWKDYRYKQMGLPPDVLLCEEMMAKIKPEVKHWSFDVTQYSEATKFLHDYFVRSEKALQKILDGNKKCWFCVYVHKYTGNWKYPYITTNEEKVKEKRAKNYKVIAIFDPSEVMELEKEELEDGSYRTLSKTETFLLHLESSLRGCWLHAPVTIMQYGDHDMVDEALAALTPEEREEITHYI